MIKDMKTIAVIAELNPCHAGHAYFLKEARLRSGADHVVMILSGDFVQRGEPAAFHKYIRTEMALSIGADLVLELPVTAACSSAQRFAEGAVSVLDSLGIVDELWFGSEAGVIAPFLETAKNLFRESSAYREGLKEALAEGLTFPAAREMALASSGKIPEKQDTGILSLPNNILGLEYCLALQKRKSGIKPQTLARAGSPYLRETVPDNGFASAAAIRRCLLENRPLSSYARLLPEQIIPVYEQALTDSIPIASDDFSSMLLYQLYRETPESLAAYLDVPADLANRIINLRGEFRSFSGFSELLKTKNRTLTQVRRALLHILLGITEADLENALHPSYVRVLGFSASGSALLSSIQEKGQIAPVSKASALSSFPSERDVFASRLYESVRSVKAGTPATDEFRRPVITI